MGHEIQIYPLGRFTKGFAANTTNTTVPTAPQIDATALTPKVPADSLYELHIDPEGAPKIILVFFGSGANASQGLIQVDAMFELGEGWWSPFFICKFEVALSDATHSDVGSFLVSSDRLADSFLVPNANNSSAIRTVDNPDDSGSRLIVDVENAQLIRVHLSRDGTGTDVTDINCAWARAF
jgi:hypothetical protein